MQAQTRPYEQTFEIGIDRRINGDGIAIGWSHLSAELLATDRLRLACRRQVATSRGYHCCLLERGP